MATTVSIGAERRGGSVTPRTALLCLPFLLTVCFCLATDLGGWFQTWQGNRAGSANLLEVALGDARRMFANHFFIKADAYFHSGFYPSIYDNRQSFRTPHIAEDSGAMEGKNTGDELAFLGPPRNWIDRFGREFYPSRHTHLDEGGAAGEPGESSEVREILPWLRLSSELDPNRIQTYTVAAFWLRQRMGKPDEAEQFLREGLRANPGSYEILFELGRIFSENHNDPARARNLWKLALRNWREQESMKPDPDKFLFIEITSHLAQLEEKEGDYTQALAYMAMCKSMSPSPQSVQKLIDGLRQRMASEKSGPAHPAP